MIIDRDYDASLWYIIKSDRKNRKEIVNFIKELPEEFLKKMRLSIEKSGKEQLNFDEPNLDFNEYSDHYTYPNKNSPGIYYYYQINQIKEKQSLTIVKTFYDGVKEDDIIELKLFPINLEYAKEMNNFEEEWIGNVTTNIKTTHIDDTVVSIKCDYSEYNIYNTPIGYFIGYSKVILKGRGQIIIYKPINLNKMPED